MSQRLYFATRESTEALLQQIEQISLIEAQKSYPVNLGAGEYTVSGSVLNDLKRRIDGLDQVDDKLDGKLRAYYDEKAITASGIFHGKRQGHPIFEMEYSNFRAFRPRVYRETKERIASLLQQKKITWNVNREGNIIKTYDDEDVRSITDAAMANLYSERVFARIEQLLSDIDHVYSIRGDSLGAGMATYFWDNGKRLVAIGIGESHVDDFNPKREEMTAVAVAEEMLVHETHHSNLIAWTRSKFESSKVSLPAVIQERLPFSAWVFIAINSTTEFQHCLSFLNDRRSYVERFEYLSQEVTDYVLGGGTKDTAYWVEQTRLTKGNMDRKLDNKTDPTSWNILSIMEMAYVVVYLESAKVVRSETEKLDEKFRALFNDKNTVHKRALQFYDAMLNWFRKCQQAVSEDAELVATMRRRRATFLGTKNKLKQK